MDTEQGGTGHPDFRWHRHQRRVAPTVRDAHARDFCNIVLPDGCAALATRAPEATIKSLATIVQVATCEQVIKPLRVMTWPDGASACRHFL
ncbi:MAG: hypothetical protein CM1200mP18_19410 [Gammaproteobacteria bacterium]|nr:MAG: hypothetical protein CM1200mP18_19410 [Gammaproteobacteria bacterium]